MELINLSTACWVNGRDICAIFSLKVAFLVDLWLSVSLIRNWQIKTPELTIKGNIQSENKVTEASQLL